jgi:hypothetical protein
LPEFQGKPVKIEPFHGKEKDKNINARVGRTYLAKYI